jgi:SPASM domain peptide maturase of grasp-with-spasm system
MDRREMENKYLSMYANCIPVKGIQRSVIYDIQKGNFDFIPNDLYDLLRNFSKKQISEIYKYYDAEQHEIIDEYLDFLLEKEYLLLMDTPEELDLFPALDLTWDMPSVITNAIIDLGSRHIHPSHYVRALQELEDMGCYYLQIRIFKNLDLFYDYKQIFISIESLAFLSVELILPFKAGCNLETYLEIHRSFSKICSITVYGCPESLVSDTIEYRNRSQSFNIATTQEKIDPAAHCGFVHPSYFSVNEQMFTEALSFNTCLNRKLGIDVYGQIKNCPSCTNSFGNIEYGSLKNIVDKPAFRKLWLLKKDQINTCKVCEFRYMCTDCRAFADSALGKPSKCSYNPYECTWESAAALS